MRKIAQMQAFGLGSTRASSSLPLPSNNHARTASLSKVASKIEKKGFRRVAGNIFILDASQDFWKLDGDKLIRITSPEVDHEESIAVDTSARPDQFMQQVLGDLTF